MNHADTRTRPAAAPCPDSPGIAGAHSLQAAELRRPAPGNPEIQDLHPTSVRGPLSATRPPSHSPGEKTAIISTQVGQAKLGCSERQHKQEASETATAPLHTLREPGLPPAPPLAASDRGWVRDGAEEKEQGASRVGGAGREVGTDGRGRGGLDCVIDGELGAGPKAGPAGRLGTRS